jgi:hypothetical protein
MLRGVWQSIRLNGIRAWIYFNLGSLLFLSSPHAFRRLAPYTDHLPEEEKLEVLRLAVSGFLSSLVLQTIAVERKKKGSPWPIGILRLWLMFEPEGRKEWEYQIERLILAWKKTDAEKQIRARREERLRSQ